MSVEAGTVCVIERRFGFSSKAVVHRWEQAITKVTPKRAYLGSGWFALDDPNRIVRPPYLDYVTVVVELRPGTPKGGKGDE